jgi:hypothetical protein
MLLFDAIEISQLEDLARASVIATKLAAESNNPTSDG